jgi:dihydrofolate reductase
VISGSATLVRSLLADGLLDELRVLLHPIVVGHGARLFEDTTARGLELVGNEAFSTGVLNLAYAPTAG